jgi:hypothetical protein
MIHLTLPYQPEDIHSLFEDVTERNLFQHTMSIPFFPTLSYITYFSSKNDLTTTYTHGIRNWEIKTLTVLNLKPASQISTLNTYCTMKLFTLLNKLGKYYVISIRRRTIKGIFGYERKKGRNRG